MDRDPLFPSGDLLVLEYHDRFYMRLECYLPPEDSLEPVGEKFRPGRRRR